MHVLSGNFGLQCGRALTCAAQHRWARGVRSINSRPALLQPSQVAATRSQSLDVVARIPDSAKLHRAHVGHTVVLIEIAEDYARCYGDRDIGPERISGGT